MTIKVEGNLFLFQEVVLSDSIILSFSNQRKAMTIKVEGDPFLFQEVVLSDSIILGFLIQSEKGNDH